MVTKAKITYVLTVVLPLVALAVFLLATPPSWAGGVTASPIGIANTNCVYQNYTYSPGSCLYNCPNPNQAQVCYSDGTWLSCRSC
jgi:hypothetical protein